MTKKERSNLDAFTLVEMSLTLLLSLIVVGMLYLALNIVTRQIDHADNEKIENIAMLKGGLSHAFFEAVDIIYQEEKQILLLSDTVQVKQFLMGREEILLQTSGGYSDTIYQGNYEVQVIREVNSLVQELELRFPVPGDTLLLKLKKDYSRSTLLNHKQMSFEY